MEWKRTADILPENGLVVDTKIDDGESRNHQTLKRNGSIWFVPDGSMYVYYRPTHWRYVDDGKKRI